MFLDTTTKTLELLLGSAVTTTAMPVTVDYVDLTTTTTIAGSTDTQSNGVTPVTILAAPAASTQRKVNGITVYNADSVSKLVTVRLNNNATLRIIVSVTLQVGDTLVYTDVNGWYSLDSSGSIKEVASGTLFGNITVAGIETDTAVGTQKVISQDASKFREGQQSTLTSGTAYTTNGSLLIMKAFLHNTGIDTSGNLTAADATDYCTGIFYSEDDKLKGFSSAAAVTAGNTPTLSNTWYLDNITGNAWLGGLITQGDTTSTPGVTQLGGMFSTNTAVGSNLIVRKSNNGTNASSVSALKSRGTNASPSVISSGDGIFSFIGYGFDGTNYILSGALTLVSTGTIGTNIVPSIWSLATSNASGSLVAAFQVDSSQNTNILVAQQLNSKLIMSATAPTISSGFGTSPSITANGTLTFRLNVGTGGTASSGVIGLPTASTGWNVTCVVFNPTATNLLHTTSQTASTTSSATITNYLTSTGAATAWPASTVLIVTAVAY